MAGRGLGSLLAAAIALGCCAPAALADDAQRLTMVEHAPAMIESLEDNGFDVGYVAGDTEAAVYLDDLAEARAARRRLPDRRRRRRRAQLRRAQGRDRGHDGSRGARGRGRRERPHQDGEGPGRGQRAGQGRHPALVHVLELRRALPLRRGPQQGPHGHHRPGDVLHLHRPERHVAGLHLRQQHHPGRRRRRDRRQQDPRHRRGRRRAVHVPPRPGPAARRGRHAAAEPDLRARRGRQRRVRHGHAGRVDGQGPAAARRRVPEGLHLEVHGPDRDLQPDGRSSRADHGDIMEAINLPHKTAGYQRQANAVLEGTTVSPSATTGLFPNPSTRTDAPRTSRPVRARCSCSRRRSATRAATTSPPSSRPRPPAPPTRRCRSR